MGNPLTSRSSKVTLSVCTRKPCLYKPQTGKTRNVHRQQHRPAIMHPRQRNADGSHQSQHGLLRGLVSAVPGVTRGQRKGFQEKTGADFLQGNSLGSRTSRSRVALALQVRGNVLVKQQHLPGWSRAPSHSASPRHSRKWFLSLVTAPWVIPVILFSTVHQVFQFLPQHFTTKNIEQREKLESSVNLHIPPFKF